MLEQHAEGDPEHFLFGALVRGGTSVVKDRPFNEEQFRAWTRHLAQQLGLPEDEGAWNAHSFRVGAVTSAIDGGARERYIKAQGRWRSETAFRSYARSQPQLRARELAAAWEVDGNRFS